MIHGAPRNSSLVVRRASPSHTFVSLGVSHLGSGKHRSSTTIGNPSSLVCVVSRFTQHLSRPDRSDRCFRRAVRSGHPGEGLGKSSPGSPASGLGAMMPLECWLHRPKSATTNRSTLGPGSTLGLGGPSNKNSRTGSADVMATRTAIS